MNLHQIFLRWLGNLLQGLATIISSRSPLMGSCFKIFFFAINKIWFTNKSGFCNPLNQPLCLLILETGSIQYLGWPIHFKTSAQNVTRAGFVCLFTKRASWWRNYLNYHMRWNLFFIHIQIEVKFRLRHNFTLGRTLKWPNAFYKLYR